jgi:hypothetical protein
METKNQISLRIFGAVNLSMNSNLKLLLLKVLSKVENRKEKMTWGF